MVVRCTKKVLDLLGRDVTLTEPAPSDDDWYLNHKHANVDAWLAKHPRFQLHFIPTSSSWLNLIERSFRELTENAIRRGVFHSVPELIAAIERFLAAHNDDPKPFVWTASADAILAKVIAVKPFLRQCTSRV